MSPRRLLPEDKWPQEDELGIFDAVRMHFEAVIGDPAKLIFEYAPQDLVAQSLEVAFLREEYYLVQAGVPLRLYERGDVGKLLLGLTGFQSQIYTTHRHLLRAAFLRRQDYQSLVNEAKADYERRLRHDRLMEAIAKDDALTAAS